MERIVQEGAGKTMAEANWNGEHVEKQLHAMGMYETLEALRKERNRTIMLRRHILEPIQRKGSEEILKAYDENEWKRFDDELGNLTCCCAKTSPLWTYIKQVKSLVPKCVHRLHP